MHHYDPQNSTDGILVSPSVTSVYNIHVCMLSFIWKKGAFSKGNNLNKNSREEKTT